MELLIFSDAHGRTDGMTWALNAQVRRPHGICFLGDGLGALDALGDAIPVYAVRGNCDWDAASATYPTELLLSMEGHTLLLTHGHLYGVKGGMGALIAHAAEVHADVVLFGHTHAAHEETIPAGTQIGNRMLESPMYLFNPGSIGYDHSFGALLLRGDTVLFSHGSV
ncbi:MAG: YfcE family phosphodiesterase [Clostridia bacterium]|nr:YfcE family phosphodiesterase [Clostridia bacterium]